MQRRTLLSLPIAGIGLPGCTRARRQDEVFAWYLRVLLELTQKASAAGGSPLGSGRLALESRVSAYSSSLDRQDLSALTKRIPAVQPSALADLRLHFDATTPISLPVALLPSAMKVDYLSPEELQSIFDEKRTLHQAWERFYKTYPGARGILAFSPVGLSADGNQAVFVSGLRCGGLCGAGYINLMRRAATGWSLEDSQLLWIS